MSEPLFPEPIRDAMRMGTSSKWAADLTGDDIRAVLWLVGEFGRRAGHVLTALDEHWSAFPPRDSVAAARAKLALEGLFRAVCGDRPSQPEIIARWGAISERAWAAGQPRRPELPDDEMGERWPVVWNGQPVGCVKDPRHHVRGCVGLWEPADSSVAAEFAAVLQQCTQTPLVVSIGGVQSQIEQPPSSSGELSAYWIGPWRSV